MHYIQLFLGLLPAGRLKNRLLSMTSSRWHVHPSALIGFNLLWRVDELEVGPNAVVYFGNTFRSLRKVTLGAGAEIGQFNWISGEAMMLSGAPLSERGTFLLGDESALTSRHHIDCSGGVRIGRFSIIAGRSSQVLTHAIDVDLGRQVTRGVRIGDYCIVSTKCIITPGISVADKIVIGAGAVVVKDLLEEESLYAGIPAVKRKSLGRTAFFTRERGRLLTKEERNRARENLL